MGKLFKFLKPYAAAVAAIICILVVQAYCDLSLPTYTSDIVNVGIQQGGIDEALPDTISKKDLNHLLLLVPSDRQKIVKNAYTESVEKYDYNGTVMELKASVKEDKKKVDRLSEILGKPMLMAAGFDSGSEMTQKIEEQMRTQMSGIPNVDKMDIYDMLEFMGAEGRNALIGQMDQQMDSMQDSIIAQAAAGYIKDAYTHIGIDTDQIETTYILHTGAKMLALAFLGMAASILVGLLASRVGAGVGRRLRENVFRKVVGFSNAEFDKFSTASLITRSTNDIQQIQMVTTMMLRMVLYAPIVGIGGIIKVAQTKSGMEWVIAIAVAAIMVFIFTLVGIAMPKFKIMQSLVDKVNLVSREILTGLSVIRAFGREKEEEKRFDEANRELTRTQLFTNRVMTFMMPGMSMIMYCITLGIVWVAAGRIDKGSMQVGTMTAFITYAMMIVMSFLMLSAMSIMLPRAGVAAERIDEVIKTNSTVNDPKEPVTEADHRGVIRFNHVDFRYPGAKEDVLSDIDFVAEPGKTTAIIGSTGCGKSTLVNLIPRFYDVTGGSIELDGHDIRDYTLSELRESIGFVPQKGILFSGTIASNLRFGKADASDEQIKKAADIAQASEFIETKNDRYESSIAQGGSNVSGGQKQRLAIARAIAKDPHIYVFDDSFSALDMKTDARLRAALAEVTESASVIIVAQRISTIIHADQILVLDDGKIVGKGTHEELLKNCDVYMQIAQSQLSAKELGIDDNKKEGM